MSFMRAKFNEKCKKKKPYCHSPFASVMSVTMDLTEIQTTILFRLLAAQTLASEDHPFFLNK